MPRAAARRAHTASVQRLGDGAQALETGALHVADNGHDVGGALVGERLTPMLRDLLRHLELRAGELDAAPLGGAERVLGPLGNHLALVLRHGGEDVDGELVGVRVVAGDEIDTSVHERREEGDVAREPVQLSDDQLGALALAVRQRLGQLGPGGMLAALDFSELADQLLGAAVEVVAHGAPLRRAVALALRRDPRGLPSPAPQRVGSGA